MWPFLQSVILIIQYQPSSYFITKLRIYLLFFQVRGKTPKCKLTRLTGWRVWIPCYFLTCRLFCSGKLSPGHYKRSGTSAAWFLHSYLVCAHIGITQLGPSDEATCDLWMSVSFEQPLKCQRQEDNKWMFKRHFPTEINRNYTCVCGGVPNKFVDKLACLCCCITSTLDPPPPLNHIGLNDTSLLRSTWDSGLCIELNFDSSDKDNVN